MIYDLNVSIAATAVRCCTTCIHVYVITLKVNMIITIFKNSLHLASSVILPVGTSGHWRFYAKRFYQKL